MSQYGAPAGSKESLYQAEIGSLGMVKPGAMCPASISEGSARLEMRLKRTGKLTPEQRVQVVRILREMVEDASIVIGVDEFSKLGLKHETSFHPGEVVRILEGDDQTPYLVAGMQDGDVWLLEWEKGLMIRRAESPLRVRQMVRNGRLAFGMADFIYLLVKSGNLSEVEIALKRLKDQPQALFEIMGVCHSVRDKKAIACWLMDRGYKRGIVSSTQVPDEIGNPQPIIGSKVAITMILHYSADELVDVIRHHPLQDVVAEAAKLLVERQGKYVLCRIEIDEEWRQQVVDACINEESVCGLVNDPGINDPHIRRLLMRKMDDNKIGLAGLKLITHQLLALLIEFSEGDKDPFFGQMLPEALNSIVKDGESLLQNLAGSPLIKCDKTTFDQVLEFLTGINKKGRYDLLLKTIREASARFSE